MHSGEQINWSPGVTLEDIEKQVVLKAFRFFGNNKTTTANALGIAIRTLDSKLEKYKEEIDSDKERESHERIRREDFLKRSRGPIRDANGAAIISGEKSPGARAADHSPDQRSYVEPASELSPQQSMPMHEQQKVQKVLHEQTPAMRNHKRR